MAVPVFRPFERFNFDDHTCYLSGKKTLSGKTTVFPDWLLDEQQLRDKPFKLLDETFATYGQLEVPYAPEILSSLNILEDTISTAFRTGFRKVEKLDQILLFQWIAKLVYGIVYHEIKTGLANQQHNSAPFDLSQSLKHKFSNLHIMLQSIFRPVIFEGTLPWTILIFPVNNPPNTFIYRDEINTLTFSLRMKDFGLIACLQDNHANYMYHREIIDKIGDHTLHPVQFEELCGMFFYSAYLLNRLPQYTILPTEEAIYIEAMPLAGTSNKPLFDEWQNKIYGQVLENFWGTWGIQRSEINKDPDRPISFLKDGEGNFCTADAILLTDR